MKEVNVYDYSPFVQYAHEELQSLTTNNLLHTLLIIHLVILLHPSMTVWSTTVRRHLTDLTRQIVKVSTSRSLPALQKCTNACKRMTHLNAHNSVGTANIQLAFCTMRE